jgi:hypothetical protein
MNYPEVKPVGAGDRQWHWVISDVKAIRTEDDMPPWRAIAGQMPSFAVSSSRCLPTAGLSELDRNANLVHGLAEGKGRCFPGVEAESDGA